MIVLRRQKKPSDSITLNRAKIDEEWGRAVQDYSSIDDRIPPQLPGYFADRFAFAVAERLPSPVVPGFDLPTALVSRDQVIERFRRPTVSLKGWMPELDSPTGLGDA